MVQSVLRGAHLALPVRPVHARGKGRRAEPVATWFEKGKAKFAGAFPELEDELAGLTAGGGYEGPGRSPGSRGCDGLGADRIAGAEGTGAAAGAAVVTLPQVRACEDRPMQLFARFVTWLSKFVPSARAEKSRARYSGAAAAARQFEGDFGRAILRLLDLGPGDVSVLRAALSIEDGQVFAVTAEGSPNFRAWQALAALGLMGEASAEPEVAREPQFGRQFYVTPSGRVFVPHFLTLAMALRGNGFIVNVDAPPPGYEEAVATRRKAGTGASGAQ
jgi:hypothetical protein